MVVSGDQTVAGDLQSVRAWSCRQTKQKHLLLRIREALTCYFAIFHTDGDGWLYNCFRETGVNETYSEQDKTKQEHV